MEVVGQHESSAGESYRRILAYFYPELVTAFVTYSLLSLFDAKLIADLKTTSLYATLGVTSTLTHFITKVAEGISVGTVVLCGQYNGQDAPEKVGVAAVSSLWTTALIGALMASILYIGAPFIYSWYGVTKNMADIGVPFLRIRALGIFFMFLYFSFIGFLRGIKNTRVPMVLFLMGGAVFLFFDWGLIKGEFGLPALGFQGSAVAFLIQHIVMCFGALIYLLQDKHLRRYSMHIIGSYSPQSAFRLLELSWPVMLDKATLAWAKIWLVRMLAPAGEQSLASFSAIRDLEQLAFIPAIAFGQVITFLVSNDVGAGNWTGVKQDLKKVLILASVSVVCILSIFSVFASPMVHIFDSAGTFTAFASRALPFISALAILDVLQLILAAALRGAGDVWTVMWVRLLAGVVCFLPMSWAFSILPLDNKLIKFILIYGSFYINAGLMSLIYVGRFAGKKWYYRLRLSPSVQT